MKNLRKIGVLLLISMLVFGIPAQVYALSMFKLYAFPEASNCVIVSMDDRLNTMAVSMRKSFKAKKYTDVIKKSQEIIDEFSEAAIEQQESLTEYAWESYEKILHYDSLNLVSLTLYLRAKAFIELTKKKEAEESAGKLVKQFYYGQCFDKKEAGFAKPAYAIRAFEGFIDLPDW